MSTGDCICAGEELSPCFFYLFRPHPYHQFPRRTLQTATFLFFWNSGWTPLSIIRLGGSCWLCTLLEGILFIVNYRRHSILILVLF